MGSVLTRTIPSQSEPPFHPLAGSRPPTGPYERSTPNGVGIGWRRLNRRHEGLQFFAPSVSTPGAGAATLELRAFGNDGLGDPRAGAALCPASGRSLGDRALHILSQDFQVIGKPGEQFALVRVSRQPADQSTVFGFDAKPFQLLGHDLHQGLSVWYCQKPPTETALSGEPQPRGSQPIADVRSGLWALFPRHSDRTAAHRRNRDRYRPRRHRPSPALPNLSWTSSALAARPRCPPLSSASRTSAAAVGPPPACPANGAALTHMRNRSRRGESPRVHTRE